MVNSYIGHWIIMGYGFFTKKDFKKFRKKLKQFCSEDIEMGEIFIQEIELKIKNPNQFISKICKKMISW